MSGTPATTKPAVSQASTTRATTFTAFMGGKAVSVELTSKARRAAERLSAPLVVEMELFFSCLLRKRLLFHEADAAPESLLERIELHPGLALQFRPIVSEVCCIDDLEGAPPVKTMPAKRADAFIPRWVRIDYRSGDWEGEFGY